jgi:hypothetical protein
VPAAAAQESSRQQPVEHAPSEPAHAGGDVSQPRGDSTTTTQALGSAERGSRAMPDVCANACEQLCAVNPGTATCRPVGTDGKLIILSRCYLGEATELVLRRASALIVVA